MADNKRDMIIRCPRCFAYDTDSNLVYDHKADEFFCRRCCYSADEATARRELDAFATQMFKAYYKMK